MHVLHAHIFHHRCLLVNVGRDHSKCRAALFKHAYADREMKIQDKQYSKFVLLIMHFCASLLVQSMCGCEELTFSLKVFGYQCCYMHITHGSLNKSYTQTKDVQTGKKIHVYRWRQDVG